MNRIIAGFVIMLLPCAALAQEASTATDKVPIEEYVPKVIIEGKWGTGPGEFGYDGFNPVDFSPNSAVFSPDDLIHPRSLAVDSKGDIYILDVANNRIQKFSKDGKHLANLKVDSWSGYELDPEKGWWHKVKGINIVIDSKDNLYYYLKRNKDGKESGEVWQFKNDKLVKKAQVPLHGGVYYEAPLGLILEEDDSIWIFNIRENNRKTSNFYEIKSAKKYDSKLREEQLGKARAAAKGGQEGKATLKRMRELEMEVTPGGVRITRESRRE